MSETTVTVRDLKHRLEHYLRLARSGQTVRITESGVPIGRIVPIADPIDNRLQAMVRDGILEWNGSRLRPAPPVERTAGSRTVAELLVEDRE